MTAIVRNTPELIALYTDFGVTGPYVGQMHAVLAAAGVPVIDLMHDAPTYDPVAAGHLLAALGEYLPEGAILVGVVDPGVGGARRALLVRTERLWMIGPDNGLFAAMIGRSRSVTVAEILWRPCRLSTTFHGRDLFAPVAGRLCRGETVAMRDVALETVIGYDQGWDAHRVIYIDGFGNAFTGITGQAVGAGALLRADGRMICHAATFGDVAVGEPFWYVNSCGLVEIAVNRGSAAERLGLALGDPVEIEFLE